MSTERMVREGEIVSDDEKHPMARRAKSGPLTQRLTGTVFGNTLIRKRIESATAVVRAEEDLFDAMRQRELAAGRLTRLGAEIEAEGLEMENRRREAQRRAKTAELQDELAHKELEFQLLEVKKATEALKGSGDDRSSYEKRLAEAEEKARFETERKILHTRQRLETIRRLRAERDVMIAEVLGKKRPEAASEEELQTIDDIRDQFQAVIDGL